MKKLLILIAIVLFSREAISQQPELIGTWYIAAYEIDLDGYYHLPVTNPQVYPFMTFEGTSNPEDVMGNGGCNDFTINVTYDAVDPSFLLNSFNYNPGSCSVAIDEFEQRMFSFFFEQPGIPFFYDFQTNNGVTTLRLHHPLLSYIVLKDQKLSVSDNDVLQVSIFPNPADNLLNIVATNGVVERIAIYSLTGQEIRSVHDPSGQLDVSDLAAGFYFLEIESDLGTQVEKFVKK